MDLLTQLESDRSETRTESDSLFKSFWMGGFECSTHINRHGDRLDLIAAVQHDLKAEEDYRLLRAAGIATARDGVRWNLIDRGGEYDFSSFIPMLEASQRAGLQVIWDLCHYGFPDDVDLLKPAFVDRFAKYTRQVARVFAEHSDEIPFWAPVNEISFFTWAASREFIFPFARRRDSSIKRQLVRAAIAGAEAVRDVDPRARLVYPEPILHAVAAPDRPDLLKVAARDNIYQYEAWDLLAGYREPGLGGHPKYLDILGVNYYYRNQWEEIGGDRSYLRWQPHDRDPRWVPLSELLARAYKRYKRPFFIAETGHFGVGRALWLREIAREAEAALQRGLPLEGICLYPILDRHDWDDPTHWHQAGLWDVEICADGSCRRVLNAEYAEELRRAQGHQRMQGAPYEPLLTTLPVPERNQRIQPAR